MRPVAPLAIDYTGAAVRHWHEHRRGQLLYAVSGVMQVETDAGAWVVAPRQAVWVPPRTAHQVGHHSTIAMRTLYVDAALSIAELPAQCCVVNVSLLLQQLILRAVETGVDYEADSAAGRLMLVILDELKALQPEPVHLPRPADPRLLFVTEALLVDPADSRSLAEWAKHSPASERTLARLFVTEVGMGFGEWRERLRLITAIPRLIDGEPVTRVAYDLGYQSPSAFIAMFRRNMGNTPARFVKSKLG